MINDALATAKAMIKRAIASLLFVVLPLTVLSANADGDCHCTDSSAVDGFHGVAMIVGNSDWKEIWDTPRETIPQFKPVGALKTGQTAHLLTFMANPLLKDGRATIHCDIRIEKADGEVQEIPLQPCYTSVISGPVTDVRMLGLRADIIAEDGDPKGVWNFDIGITDMNREARLGPHLEAVFLGAEDK